MGLLSWLQKNKDNYLSINYKAEFARFRENYRTPWIESEICGNQLEELINKAEKQVIETTQTLKTWDKNIDFKVNTYIL